MTDNSILFALPEIQAVLSEIESSGNAFRIDKKEISGFLGKSEVIDKYAQLYKMLCEAIEEYSELLKYDVESIKGFFDRMVLADQLAARSIQNSITKSGGVLNVLPD